MTLHNEIALCSLAPEYCTPQPCWVADEMRTQLERQTPQRPCSLSPCCTAAICTLWVLPRGGATPSPPLGLEEGATWLMTPPSLKALFRVGCSLATHTPDNWFTGEKLDFLQAGFLFLPFSFLFLLFKQSDLDYDEVLEDFSRRCWFYRAWLAWTPAWTPAFSPVF